MKPAHVTKPATNNLYRAATSSLRTLPDFLIIGTQKGGTTSLYLYLNEHPNIGGAVIKEVSFFDKNYSLGLSWYRAQFPMPLRQLYTRDIRKQNYTVGEASPGYLIYPHAPGRIAKILPCIKLIALLRNPVERAYSQYRHNVSRGFEQLSFADAIEAEEERTQAEKEKVLSNPQYNSTAFFRYSYLARGVYVDQLKHWLDFFPREQLLILKSEELNAEPTEIFKQTLAFLDVPVLIPASLQKEFKHYNTAENTSASKIDPAMRERLIAYFEPHNARLYEFLGRDFGWS
jgi:hypothetical protein